MEYHVKMIHGFKLKAVIYSDLATIKQMIKEGREWADQDDW